MVNTNSFHLIRDLRGVKLKFKRSTEILGDLSHTWTFVTSPRRVHRLSFIKDKMATRAQDNKYFKTASLPEPLVQISK